MRRLPTAAAVVVLAALTAAVHLAVLGWDTGYDVDATTGQVSGP